MLSKWFQLGRTDLASIDAGCLAAALTVALASKYETVNVQPCEPGGTLGIFFTADLNNERKFVKTHLPGFSNKENLKKEIQILKVLYGSFLFLEELEVVLEEESYTVLVMDHLSALNEMPGVEAIQEIIEEYDRKLKGTFPSETDLPSLYTLNQLGHEAENALNLLAEHRLLSKDMIDKCLLCMDRVHGAVPAFSLCHGDLSNKNIMKADTRLIVVDWEDAFWGMPRYDLYYWLTFMDQSRYYASKELLRHGIDIAECIDWMIAITVLKCGLSYKNGSFRSHRFSFEERLDLIFAIMGSE